MPRTAENPGKPARNRVQVLLDDDDQALLDDQRGTTSESAYCRRLIHHGLLNHQTTGHEDTESVDKTHRHKAGDLIAEHTVKGETVKTYRCTHPGCKKEIAR